ncbi:hypothetical protein [Thiothrix sp.]|uniref:hypothetical protein n=1 Tax=Thiothrix sp. TaxID=1032 RepID=UPI00257A8723|nr:hypothetical protein [Thiothrix sp.]
MNPHDLATIISYETGGTFDPRKRGPTTQWGQHQGLIQFGEPQAQQFGVDWNDPLNSQLGHNGAIAKYFRASGWQPGMSLLDAYSIVNAGAPGRYNVSDANNGGAPGTVRDKVERQMGDHAHNAARLLGGTQYASSGYANTMTDVPQNYQPNAAQRPSLTEFMTEKQRGNISQPQQLPNAAQRPSLTEFMTEKQRLSAESKSSGDINSMTAESLLQKFPDITGDVPPIPGSQEEQARARYSELSKAPAPTPAERVIGGAETALSIGTGATTGVLGQVLGAGKGFAREIASGEFGTNAAANRIAQDAHDVSASMTYAPKTDAGQSMAQATGEALMPLQAVAPLAQMQTIGAASRAAALPQTAARATEKSIPSRAISDIANAKHYGINVMTSDINQPTTWGGKMAQAVGERVPVVGTGGQRAAQQATRQSALQNLFRDYTVESPPAINDVTANLLQKRSADLGKYSGMKNGVIDSQAGNPVNVGNTIASIDGQIAKLQGMNTQAVKPLVSKLEDYKTAFANQDLPTIELLRKQLGDELQSPDMATVRTASSQAAGNIYGALKKDMGNHIQQFGARRDFDKWQVANSRLSEMIGETSNSGLKSVLKKGEATPETIRSLLFSNKPSDVGLLRKNLTPDGRDKAKTAIMQDIFAKSGGDMDSLSPDKFMSQMQKMGAQTGGMMTPVERANLSGLFDALKLTKQASVANAKPMTGAELTGFATPAALTYATGGNPVTGVAATAGLGLMAKAYESPVVRDLLVNLGRTTDRAPRRRAYDGMLSSANNVEPISGVLSGLFRDVQANDDRNTRGAYSR